MNMVARLDIICIVIPDLYSRLRRWPNCTINSRHRIWYN